jgi:hypothetical protein
MKIIITESQHNVIVKMIMQSQQEDGEYFDPTIIVCNEPSEIPKWVKASIHDDDDMWEQYIDAFGPIYIIRNDEDWFILQKNEKGTWRIGDKKHDIISEFKMMSLLGIAKYGIDVETLLGL